MRSYSPDVAIVDIRLPPTHNDEGLRAALEIRALHPSVGVLVLSQYVEVGLAMKLLADSAEGAGYLLKDRIGEVKEFIGAVRRVAGGSAIDPIIVSTLLSKRRGDDPLDDLTPREREVLGSSWLRVVPTRESPTSNHAARCREVRLHHLRSSGFLRALTIHVEFWPFCSTCVPESRASQDTRNPPPDGKSPVFRRAVTAARLGRPARSRGENHEDPGHPRRAGRADNHEPSRDQERVGRPNLARMARWSAHHRKKAIFGWLAFAVLLFAVSLASPLEDRSSRRPDRRVGTRRPDPLRRLQATGRRVGSDPEHVAHRRPGVQGRGHGRCDRALLDAVARVESPYDGKRRPDLR